MREEKIRQLLSIHDDFYCSRRLESRMIQEIIVTVGHGRKNEARPSGYPIVPVDCPCGAVACSIVLEGKLLFFVDQVLYSSRPHFTNLRFELYHVQQTAGRRMAGVVLLLHNTIRNDEAIQTYLLTLPNNFANRARTRIFRLPFSL
jgi:hypothetical protein